MTAHKDPIVLSYEDSLLRESDLKLLDHGNWLNDNLISFWFAYLTNTLIPTNGKHFAMLPAEIVQIIKSAEHSKDLRQDMRVILESGNYLEKSVLFIPLNDCDYTSHGGSHWSLLVLHHDESDRCKFEHYDSSYGGSNFDEAKSVSKTLTEIISGDSGAFDLVEAYCVKQTNSYDCGVHLIVNSEALISKLFFGSKKELHQLANLAVIESKREKIKSIILELSSKRT